MKNRNLEWLLMIIGLSWAFGCANSKTLNPSPNLESKHVTKIQEQKNYGPETGFTTTQYKITKSQEFLEKLKYGRDRDERTLFHSYNLGKFEGEKNTISLPIAYWYDLVREAAYFEVKQNYASSLSCTKYAIEMYSEHKDKDEDVMKALYTLMDYYKGKTTNNKQKN